MSRPTPGPASRGAGRIAARHASWRNPLLAAVIGLTTAGAATLRAEDAVSVTGFFSLEFLLDGQEDEADSDPAVGAILRSGVNIGLRSGRTDVFFSPGVRFSAFSDESVDGQELLPSLRASLIHRAPRDTLNLSASFVPELRRFSDPDARQSGEGDAVQLTSSASANWRRGLTPRTSMGLGAFVRRRDYTETADDLVQTTSFGVDADIAAQVDPLTTVTTRAGVRQFLSEDDDDVTTPSFSVGLSRVLSPTLTGDLSLGLSAPFRQDDGVDIGGIGGFGLQGEGPDYGWGVSVNQSVEQDADGEVQNRLTGSVFATHRVDQDLTLRLDVRGGLNSPIFGDSGDDDVIVTIRPNATYALTRFWSASLGYEHRIERDEVATDSSNLLFLRFSRDLTLLQ